MGGLDRKVGGLDRAWPAFGRPLDWLGQRLDRARPTFSLPLGGFGQRFDTASSAFGRPFDGLGQRLRTAARALWEGRGGGNNNTDMYVVVELSPNALYRISFNGSLSVLADALQCRSDNNKSKAVIRFGLNQTEAKFTFD